jgi:hypothetical protein
MLPSNLGVKVGHLQAVHCIPISIPAPSTTIPYVVLVNRYVLAVYGIHRTYACFMVLYCCRESKRAEEARTGRGRSPCRPQETDRAEHKSAIDASKNRKVLKKMDGVRALSV